MRENLRVVLKPPGIFVLLMLAATAVVAILTMTDVFVYTPDSARYLIWGHSLAEFKGFVDTTGPETVRYVVHSPLFSVLLVPALWVSSSIAAAKSVNIIFALLFLGLAFFFAKKEYGTPVGLAVLAFLFLNPLVLIFSTQILSDLAFATAVMSIFLLSGRIMGLTKDQPIQKVLPYAVLLTCAVLVREVGITILAAVTAAMLLRKNYRPALVLLFTAVTVYLLWILRNEAIVAIAERPPIRNMALLTDHLFTTQDASLLIEWWERLKANVSVYGNLLGRSLFLTQHHPRLYGLIMVGMEPYATMTSLLGPVERLWMILPAIAAVYGIWVARKSESTRLFLLFLAFYLLLVLIYPFNDQRFLFPLLPFQALYIVVGVRHVAGKLSSRMPKAVLSTGGILAGLVLLIPNLVWSYSYWKLASLYRESPIRLYEQTIGRDDIPDLYTKPVRFVGEWLQKTNQQSVVIGGFWKELAFSLGPHKLLDLNQLLPVDHFESMLRDYQVHYLVVAAGRHGIREFESQMALSRRYTFQTVYKVGNLEVVKVARTRPGALSDSDTFMIETEPTTERVIAAWKEGKTFRDDFQRGVRLLAEGKILEGRAIVDTLTVRTNGHTPAFFFSAVAREFDGNTGEAADMFGRIRYLSQSGPYLVHAYYHLQLMKTIEDASAESDRAASAQALHLASLNYWNLGFRRKAWELLDRSLERDSAFAPALVFGMFYKIQDGDTTGARGYYDRLFRSDPLHTLVRPLGRIIEIYDQLKRRVSPVKRSELVLELASLYEKIGIRENAIDELLRLLDEQPNNASALRQLGALYVAKERYVPARRILSRAAEVDPSDEGTKEALRKLDELAY